MSEDNRSSDADVSIRTLIDLFRHATSREKNDLINYRGEGGWRPVSTKELAEKVRTVAMGLYALGVRSGHHVGILSENRFEWTLADLGTLACGAADVPIYATQAPKQVAWILNDAGVEVLFVSDQAQYDRVRESLNTVPRLRAIVSFDRVEAPSGKVMSFEDFLNWGRAADEAEPGLYPTLSEATAPETLATLIYTSGTTGEPKGVMLTHSNLVSNALSNFGIAQVKEGEVALSFLPFSHIFERTTIYMYLYAGMTIYYAESVETVARDLTEARPDFMTSVPRLFEKIYARAMERAEEGGKLKFAIASWAVGVAKEWARIVSEGGQPDLMLSLRHKLADALVFSKWRQAMGGRVRALVSGGAPLPIDLALVFYGAGLPIYQGYGLTESSPTISSNHPIHNRLGSVGKPIRDVEVKIAEDGEILCSGPNVMKGYYGREEETSETLTADAAGKIWLHTGDVGYLDHDGFLYITDRKKDLIKTSGGKYIAPQPIESAIKRSRFVSQVVVIGDQRKFPAALIVPNFETLGNYAAQQGIERTDGASLIGDPRIVRLFEDEVERHTDDLSQYEKIKAIMLLEKEMTVENGELTPTLKVKRRIVTERNKSAIDQLYAEKEAAYAASIE
ncbi:MAG: long-chain fatty acid--CoA ligase [Acidobacteriota bacterium]|nr:MAG: long-chain fatty acid--CoA ligase [Acidobacteriota bacterium]